MVGVPLFFLCCSGVSSRTLLAPYWLTFKRSMNGGNNHRLTTNTVSAEPRIRKDG